MPITAADPAAPEICALLEQHMAAMVANSPEGACHFLDIAALQEEAVTFWAVWTADSCDAKLMGCGAIKEIASDHGEIKSMRTHGDYLRHGIAAKMLRHIIETAGQRGYTRISLETGSGNYFDPARQLYLKNGFEYCGPFGAYVDDGFARYMTLALQ